MKKFGKVLTALTISFAVMTTIAAAETIRYITSGEVKISGSIEGGQKDENLSVIVTEHTFDWNNDEQWQNYSESQNFVKYNAETTVSDKGKYEFAFWLTDSGKYNVLVGAVGDSNNTYASDFEFVNKTKNDEIKSKLLTGSIGDIESILFNQKKDIGIFDDKFDDADDNKAAVVLKESVKDYTAEDLTFEKMYREVCLSYIASMLNEKKIQNIDGYMKCFENEDFYDDYDSNISNEITSAAAGKDIQSVKQLNDLMRKSTILYKIKSTNKTSLVSKLLNKHIELFGVSQSKITNSLCDDLIKNKDKIYNFDDLKKYITEYKESSNGVGVGGGGSGGGIKSNSSKNNAYSGAKLDDEPVNPTDKDTQMVVFSDIDDVEWAKEAILQLYAHGVIDGREYGKFVPNDTVKREEFAKMLTVAFNMNLKPEAFEFEDVKEENWCYKYIRTAVAAGITNGTSEKTFGIGENITRQDLCKMVYSALLSCNYKFENSENEFSDSEIIAEYAQDAIKALTSIGIISGYEDGFFRPNNFATRAEAAKIIYAAYRCIN